MRETARDFMRDEAGMGTVEIICKGLYAKWFFQIRRINVVFIGKTGFACWKVENMQNMQNNLHSTHIFF